MLKMENADFHLQLKQVDICELTRQICAEFYEDILTAGLSFEIDIPETPYYVQADEEAMGRVIGNLLSNAGKYNQTGEQVGVKLSVLKKQVEEISSGRITQTSIGIGLSVGVAVSVGIAMLRILTGIPLMWFMIPGYAISLLISFFVPPLYTGVAFDSGGVASGPMTTTFLLPFAVGACTAVGGNLLTDAFGIVAMVAMTPLIAIQILGLVYKLRRASAHKHDDKVEDTVITNTDGQIVMDFDSIAAEAAAEAAEGDGESEKIAPDDDIIDL